MLMCTRIMFFLASLRQVWQFHAEFLSWVMYGFMFAFFNLCMGTHVHDHAACNAQMWMASFEKQKAIMQFWFIIATRVAQVHLCLQQQMVRAKNTADDDSVVKLLRSNMTSLGDGFKSPC